MLLASVVGALALFLFLALVLYVGVWASRETEDDDSPDHSSTHGERLQSHIPGSRPRGNKTPNELLLYLLVANRSLPVALGIASMTATWVGAGYINGTAEAVFDLGLAWCQAPLGYAISLVIGGALFADKVRPTKAVTMLDPFQQYYGPWIAVLLCVPAVCGELLWTACNLSALGDTVSIISELNPTVAMVAAVGVILFYTSLGGIVSVIYTDVVQICTTGLGIWSCMAFLTRSKVVGKVGAPHNDWLGRTEEGDGSRMLDQFLMTILGGIPWQVYFQRILSSDSIFTAKMLSYVSAVGCLLLAIPPVITGAAARSANFTMAGYPGPFNLMNDHRKHVLPLTMHYLIPEDMTIVGQLAITAAVMSSVDSSMLSASSLIAHNVYCILLRPTASDMEVVTVLRCMLCLLGAVATAMAWSVESVYRLWALSSDLVYVLLFPQFVALYFLRSQSNAYGAVIGFLVGIVARVACGEPQMGVPVLLKLPLYDVERGQLFPFRTLCMLLSLGSLLGGSHLAASVFQSRLLPDVWHCFTADTLILYCPPNSPAAVASPIVCNIGDRASAPFKYSASQTVVSSGGSDETPKQEPKTATLSLPETVPTPSAAQLESSPTPTPQQSPADIDKPKKKRKRPKDGESKSNGGGAKSTSSSAPSVQNEAVKLEAAAVPKGGPGASADPDKKSREARRSKGATPKGSARSQKTVGGGIVGSNDGSMVCKEYNNPKETGKTQMPAT